MKNKVLVVIVALVSLIIMTSCKQNNIDQIKEEINSCLESIVVPESVSSNIELLKDINGYTVTWQSNNESVLNSNDSLVSYKNSIFVNNETSNYGKIVDYSGTKIKKIKKSS